MPVARKLAVIGALVAAILASQAMAQPADGYGPQGPPFVPTRPIAIVGGTLIDATGAPPKTGYTVLIEGKKIVKVGPSASVEIPANATRFDATGMTVMPGLISANQHVQINPLYPAPAADMPLDELRARWEANFAQMPRRAYVYLMQGITTMRQTSGPWKRILPVKKQIDAGELPGPRILLGGALMFSPQTFAHVIEANHTPPDAIPWLKNEFAWLVVDDLEKDTDQMLGADFTYWKIAFGDQPFDGKNDFTDAQVRRIIEKAHKAGKRVDIHANASPDGYARLLKFDFDSLEHPFQGDFLTDARTIAGYAKKGIIVDTLLAVRTTQADYAKDPDRFDQTDFIMSTTPEEYRIIMRYRDKMLDNQRHPDQHGLSIYDKRSYGGTQFGQNGPSYNEQQREAEVSRENMRHYIAANVKFSTGTDSPSFMNFQQGNPYAGEMVSEVRMGMTPMQAIMASTRNGAEVAGMLDQLGTIEVGKLADVIVVAGDPLISMEAMRRVAVVIKEGVRYK